MWVGGDGKVAAWYYVAHCSGEEFLHDMVTWAEQGGGCVPQAGDDLVYLVVVP